MWPGRGLVTRCVLREGQERALGAGHIMVRREDGMYSLFLDMRGRGRCGRAWSAEVGQEGRDGKG